MNRSPWQPSGMLQLTLRMCFSRFLWQQNAGHSLFLLEGVSNTPGIDCPRGGNTVLPSREYVSLLSSGTVNFSFI